MDETQSADWVSITVAAQRLTEAGDAVDRSTLSRYLKQHSEALPIRASGKANLVDFETLAVHRAENVRIRSMPAEVRPKDAAAAGIGRRFAGSQSDGAARKANADADLREMEVAERRKQLTPTAEVDRAGRDAVALMMSAFDRAVEREAAEAAMKYEWDERTLRIVLKRFSRTGLEIFHKETLEHLDRFRRTRDAGEEIDESAGDHALQ